MPSASTPGPVSVRKDRGRAPASRAVDRRAPYLRIATEEAWSIAEIPGAQHNVWITTSGEGWEPAVKFCMNVLGPDRVLYAMDPPYQQSADECAAYDAFDLSPEHKKMLMQTNAEQVFRLK